MRSPGEVLGVFRDDAHRARMLGVMSLYLADGRPPFEKSTPPAMIADFEAQCVLGDDRLWRIQSHVLRPIFVGRDRPFSVSVDPLHPNHGDWTADCIAWLRDQDHRTIEATSAAEDDWVAHVSELGHATLYPRTNSWYMGANIPGKPRIFMPYIGGVGAYRQKCDAVVANGYQGFAVG